MILYYIFAFLLILFLLPYIVYFILFLHTKEIKEKTIPKDDYEPTISIVIATYNEEENISKKLENVFQLDYPSDKMEVIVVDASTDNTPEIVKKWMIRHPNIRLIREKHRRGLASALNLGYSLAKGEIVIKTDCDQLLGKDSIKQIVSNFVDPNIGAVSGRQLLMDESKHETGYRSLVDVKRLIENKVDSIYLLEPFSAFRKRLIESIDKRSVADEAELGLKIRKKGYKVIFDPDAYFYEKIPSKTIDRLKIKQRRAQGHIRLMLSNLDILFNPKYGKYGMIIFPLNFYLVVIEPWLLLLISLVFPIFLYSLFALKGMILCTMFYSILIVSYAIGYPKFFSGFLDSQLALIIGLINLTVKGPSYIWQK